jgi:MFS family permease
MGIQQTLLAFSAGLSPIVFGWGAETFSWSASFAATGVLMLVPAAVVWTLDEVPRPAPRTARRAARRRPGRGA